MNKYGEISAMLSGGEKKKLRTVLTICCHLGHKGGKYIERPGWDGQEHI